MKTVLAFILSSITVFLDDQPITYNTPGCQGSDPLGAIMDVFDEQLIIYSDRIFCSHFDDSVIK